MPATVAGIHLGPDTHANRPAANASGLPIGSLYSCSDHDLIYVTDGSSWTTWATLGGGGGGGLTREYLGTNSIGGSTAIPNTQIAKTVTPANACDIVSIDVYAAWQTSSVGEISVSVYADSAGSPGNIVAMHQWSQSNVLYMNNGNARWLSLPIHHRAAASTPIWLVVFVNEITLYYAGSGVDKTGGGSASWHQDWNAGGDSDTTRDYSIRAATIR